jgi:hypothetical protein
MESIASATKEFFWRPGVTTHEEVIPAINLSQRDKFIGHVRACRRASKWGRSKKSGLVSRSLSLPGMGSTP